MYATEIEEPICVANTELLPERPCLSAMSRAWIEVDLEAIRDNVRAVRGYIGRERDVLAVVKANAYGHGMVPVARAVIEAGAAWLGVASVAEGAELRDARIMAPIALLCPFSPDEANAILRYDITPLVGDSAGMEALVNAASRRRTTGDEPPQVHLEIDTGIGRSGVLPADSLALWQMAERHGLRVTGLATHFANPDGANPNFTQQQIALFQQTRAELEAAGARFDWIHLSGSAAVLRFEPTAGSLPRPDVQNAISTPDTRHPTPAANYLVRPGLLLYGLRPPVDADITLHPALTLKARVASVRVLPPGHNVSYGLTCTLSRPTIAATVLIGYGDGYPRRLSNQGHVLLHGMPAPILGRVCMDQIVVDVTDLPPVASGSVAVCIGEQGNAHITAESLAARIETTEHEITTCLTARLPRLYLKGTSATA